MSATTLSESIVFNDLKRFKTLLPAASKNDKKNALMKAAERGKSEYISLLLPVSSEVKRSALMEAVRHDQLGCVAMLLPHPIRDSEALCQSVRHNHIQIFDYLLPLVPLPSHDFMAVRSCFDKNSTHNHRFSMFERVLNEAFERFPEQLEEKFSIIVGEAVYKQDHAALSVLLNHPAFTGLRGEELLTALENHDMHCFELLFSHARQDMFDSALVTAVRYNYADMVEMLLSRADPLYNNSAALRCAIEHNFEDFFELLYPISDPQAALYALQEKWPKNPEHWMKLEERICVDLHNTLQHHTQHSGVKATQRKI